MSPAELTELAGLVAKEYPGTPVLQASARTGQGFEALAALLDQEGNFGRRILNIDYDTYAEGEAELGWLNSTVNIIAPEPFVLDDLLLEVVRRLQDGLVQAHAEVAHLKAIGLADTSFGVANLESSATKPELSLASHAQVSKAELIINARVATDPQVLEKHVRDTVQAVSRSRFARAEYRTMQSFRPGRPQPTHRYAQAK